VIGVRRGWVRAVVGGEDEEDVGAEQVSDPATALSMSIRAR
jgi:hypothetical protein